MKKILVIEDEPEMRRNLTALLRYCDYEPVAADNGRVGIEAARRENPDLILCDVMMPNITGMDFHARVAELEPALAARIAFVTGGAFTSSAREFLDRVPNRRIEKPFDLKALRALVNELVR